MKKVCVYGSLRPGEYNYSRFKSIYGDDIKPLGSYTILGFDLFDLGCYPGVKLSNNKQQPLIVDILEVNEACFNSIKGMELGAGYVSHQLTIDDHECVIYIYSHSTSKQVEDGDWSKYIKEKLKKLKDRDVEYV